VGNGAVAERSLHRQISTHKLTGSTVISLTCSDEVPEVVYRLFALEGVTVGGAMAHRVGGLLTFR
jgi:hypothetical protein